MKKYITVLTCCAFCVLLPFISCTTTHPLKEELALPVDNESLEKNIVETHGVHISLPAGWRAERYSITKEFVKDGRISFSSADGEDARGSYESFDIDEGYSREQFLQFYASERYVAGNDRVLIRNFRPETNVTVFSAELEDEVVHTILLFDERRVHALEMIYAKSYRPANSRTALLAQGIEETDAGSTARIQRGSSSQSPERSESTGGFSFIPSSSGFVWLSDIRRGIILGGSIAGRPAVLRCEALDDEQGSGKPDPVGKLRTTVDNFDFISHGTAVTAELRLIEKEKGVSPFRMSVFLEPVSEKSMKYLLSGFIETGRAELQAEDIIEDEAVHDLLAYDLFFPEQMRGGAAADAED